MTAANENDVNEIELLLPWHAAGTLSKRDRQRVEAALADDPELARRYELVREDLGETIHLNETLGAPSARAMEALLAKIDAEPARAPSASINFAATSGAAFGPRIREFFASLSPRTLAWSASAAALAIVLQAGLIAGIVFKEQGAPRPGSYQTASMPLAAKVEGSYALIRFQPEAKATDIGKFLETNKLTIADGPAPGGLFRVRVSPSKVSNTGLAGIVKKLQGDSVVGFIAPTE
jgi:anti-sigma-K factor RskA